MKALLFSLFIFSSFEASALDVETAQDQALRLYGRIAGVLPNAQSLQTITTMLRSGQVDQAAFTAMGDINFYKLTIKNLFNPMSNRAQTNDVALNDFSTTIVGLVLNNQNFDQVLYGDVIYTAADNIQTIPGLVRADDNAPPAGQVRPLLINDNGTIRYMDFNHYSDLAKIADWPNHLTARNQSDIYALTPESNFDSEDIGGVLTSRQWLSEFASAGTNRRNVRFAFFGFLGKDMIDLHETSSPDIRVRQDVDRVPGGNSQTYLNTCAGCHANMDSLAGAFAYVDYPDNRSRYNRTLSNNNKQFRSSNVFPSGYRLNNNSWLNFWTSGQNSYLGWRTRGNLASVSSGYGINSFGTLLGSTQAFSDNLAKKVFATVCMKTPSISEASLLTAMARNFERGIPNYSTNSASNPYNLKSLFAESAKICFGK
jgi:hypothetical protein